MLQHMCFDVRNHSFKVARLPEQKVEFKRIQMMIIIIVIIMIITKPPAYWANTHLHIGQARWFFLPSEAGIAASPLLPARLTCNHHHHNHDHHYDDN